MQQRCRNRLSHFSCCPGWRLTSIVWYWSRHRQYSPCFVGRWEQKAYFHCPTSTYTASTLLLWSTVALALSSQWSSRTHHEWTLVSNLPFTLSLAWLFVCIYQLSWPRHEFDARFNKSRKVHATVSTLSPCRNHSKATTGTICLSHFHSHGFLYAYSNCLDHNTNLMPVLLSQENSTQQFQLFCRAAIVARQQLGQFAFHTFTCMAFCMCIATVLTATQIWCSFC
jgi:hypothetical protein